MLAEGGTLPSDANCAGPGRVFRIQADDNVATALEEIPVGTASVIPGMQRIAVREPIPPGHKVALEDIAQGAPIIKYGMTIAHATTPIAAGTWVHLHCAASAFDARSSGLDVKTGAPHDIVYE